MTSPISPAKRFDRNLKELNSQFWLLRTAAQQAAGTAAGLTVLDGIDHRKLLAVAFPASHDRDNVRLRTKTATSDLTRIAEQAHAWLPTYFTLLTKATAESTLLEIYESWIESTPERKGQFDQFRRNTRPRALPKKRALERLVQATVRGDFEDIISTFSIGGLPSQVTTSDITKLQRGNRTRNHVAHELDPHADANPPVSVAFWKSYANTLQKLVHAIERLL